MKRIHSVSPDELINGTWVVVRGVLRWQSDMVQRANLIACPTCGARLTEPCRRKGRTVNDHAARIVERRCACGGHVTRRQKYCSQCREVAKRASWRLSKQQAATREQAA